MLPSMRGFALWVCALLAALPPLSPAAAPTPAAATAPASTILVFGDSLSAGYGLDANTGWVYLLQQRLQSQGLPYAVVNASVSGETSAGGLARLPAALDQYRPQLVLIELGANDGLRGQPLNAMRANLEKMIGLARAAKATPLLLEMRLPPNYGTEYTEKFRQTYDDIAGAERVTLVPFFLAAIAADRERWFQEDGIHPNAAAQPRLLDAVWGALWPVLSKKVHP